MTRTRPRLVWGCFQQAIEQSEMKCLTYNASNMEAYAAPCDESENQNQRWSWGSFFPNRLKPPGMLNVQVNSNTNPLCLSTAPFPDDHPMADSDNLDAIL